MRHEWILNVLADLHLYAELNGLPETAERAGAAMAAAERELARLHAQPQEAPLRPTVMTVRPAPP